MSTSQYICSYKIQYYLNLPQSRTRASDPVLDATSSISEAFARVIVSASLNSHSSFKEHASVRTAEWPPPAASFRTSPTHLQEENFIKIIVTPGEELESSFQKKWGHNKMTGQNASCLFHVSSIIHRTNQHKFTIKKKTHAFIFTRHREKSWWNFQVAR